MNSEHPPINAPTLKLMCGLSNRILRVLSQKLRLAGDFDFRALAKQTPGYVGADLSALTGAAGVIAVKRIFQEIGSLPSVVANLEHRAPTSDDGMQEDNAASIAIAEEMSVDPPSLDAMSLENGMTTPLTGSGTQTPLHPSASSLPFETLPAELQILSIASFLRAHPAPLTGDQLAPLAITNSDFQTALSQVQPSSKREGFTTVPDVTWSMVGALQGIRDELRMAIVQPVKHPELFEAVGIANPCGVLLWGPPGCGKTLLAKAVANESRANFISIKGPELLNKVSHSLACQSIPAKLLYSTSEKAKELFDKSLLELELLHLVSSSSMSWMLSCRGVTTISRKRLLEWSTLSLPSWTA